MDPGQRFSRRIDEMNSFIKIRDWNGLEAYFGKIALKLSGPEAEHAIAGVDMTNFSRGLKELTDWAYKRVQQIEGNAVCMGYEIDNEWSSWFFIYDNYRPAWQNNDEWAATWQAELQGPALPVFTELYETYGGFDLKDEAQVGRVLYLIARTVAAFGREIGSRPDPGCAVCVAYHGQDPIMRIIELQGQ